MRDLENLLANALPEELENTPPAPVDKGAIRDKTFQKLGLEIPGKKAAFPANWAAPVAKHRRPWAVLAACLVLAVTVAVGFGLRPLLTSSNSPLPAGSYLELQVTQAAFDEEQWAIHLTLEAKTDLDLDHLQGENVLSFFGYVSRTTSSTRLSLAGLNQETLANWTETGEDTYRCEDVYLEIDPVFQAQNRLTGSQDLELELIVYFGEENPLGTRENSLMADAPFTVDIPEPPEAVPGTSFDLSVSDASFDQEAWAVVLTLQLETDGDLDSLSTQRLYSWWGDLWLSSDSGDVAGSQISGDTLDTLAQWTQVGDNTYESSPVSLPIRRDFQREYNLTGPTTGTLYLVLTDLHSQTGDPVQFFPQAEFSVDLPDPGDTLDPTAQEPYLDCQVDSTSFDKESWSMVFQLTANTNLDLDAPNAAQLYGWNLALNLPTGTGYKSPDIDAFQREILPTWEETGTDTYQCQVTLTLDPEFQKQYDLSGELEGRLDVTVTVLSSQGLSQGSPLSSRMDFTLQLPEYWEAPAPAAGTYLEGRQANAHYASSQYALALDVSVDTDLELDYFLADAYYHWSSQVTLTGQNGQTCTLTPQTNSLSWQEVGMSRFSQKAAGAPASPNPETEYFYQTLSDLVFPLRSEEYTLPSEFCQRYGLSGEVQGVLTLTCREILGHLASSASKDWTLEIPFTATFPES